MDEFSKKKFRTGFTLIEVIIAIGVFVIIAVPIYFAYSNIFNALQKNQARSSAITLLQNQIETIRNMPYSNVGVEGGYPTGRLLANQNINYQGHAFNLKITVRNIDDPFDGTVGGNPNDTAPADYKLVELTIVCLDCPNAVPLILTTVVSPKDLETATNNGSIFINVFDANGIPVSGANVHIFNGSTSPNIVIDDTTNLSGVLQLVDIPTSTNSYQITVSKPGFSSEKTYPLNAPGNPNPVKPHATVAQNQLTQISFAVDRASTINLKTTDQFCAPVPNVSFSITGTKLIGRSPDVLKFTTTSTTDANGNKTLNNIEWDTYNFILTGGTYDLSGNNFFLPLIVNPSSTYDMGWLVLPPNPSSLLVTVEDQNKNLINDASVEIQKTGYDQTSLTGRRTFSQADWSGGQYSSKSANLGADTLGQLTLLNNNGQYPTSTEWLISNTFDLGTASTTFYNLNWQPQSQPPQTGPNSLNFQIAANNDGSAWNFLGPDGTANTFYTASSSINSIPNNSRYFRYKVYMKTLDQNYTPLLQNVAIDFSSLCIPAGQVFVNGLSNGAYTITIQKSGFQAYTDTNLLITNNWQSYNAILQP